MLKRLIMFVVGYYIGGIGRYRTVNELIIIMVCCYQLKMIIRRNELHKFTVEQKLNDVFSYP